MDPTVRNNKNSEVTQRGWAWKTKGEGSEIILERNWVLWRFQDLLRNLFSFKTLLQQYKVILRKQVPSHPLESSPLPLTLCNNRTSRKDKDATFLLAVGSFLLYSGAFLLTIDNFSVCACTWSFSTYKLSFLLKIRAFLLTMGKCVQEAP